MKKILKKKNIKYYLIMYLIVEILTRFTFTSGLLTYIWEMFKIIISSNDFETAFKSIILFLITLGVWLAIFFMITLPVTIVLLARKTVDDTQEKQNRKYTSREDIIYYREKFENISPTTISLMENLKVEEDKDLSATIMKLQLNNNIALNGESIEIISNDVSKLTKSERKIFNSIEKGNINKQQIIAWKNEAITEAKDQGYIVDKRSTKGLLIRKVLLIILFFLLVYGAKYFKDFNKKYSDLNLDEYEEISEIVQNKEVYNEMVSYFIEGTSFVFCALGALAWPIFYTVYIVRYQNENNSLKRTKEGEKLTDEILGMKRFIHDFSMLDQAEKEQLILWDDFLIYAIVLEENTKIVDDIIEMKSMRCNKYLKLLTTLKSIKNT